MDGEVLRCRNGKDFENNYLRKGFEGQISVLRILDSRREGFKISPVFVPKIKIVNIITAPEIEMLIIFSEGRFFEFKKKHIKPSEFCKEIGYKT